MLLQALGGKKGKQMKTLKGGVVAGNRGRAVRTSKHTREILS
jgi:hypothetical protein